MHAKKRARGPGGKFLSAEEKETYDKNQAIMEQAKRDFEEASVGSPGKGVEDVVGEGVEKDSNGNLTNLSAIAETASILQPEFAVDSA